MHRDAVLACWGRQPRERACEAGAVASKGEHVDIEVDGRTVRVSNPEQGLLRRARRDQARPRQLLPRGRRGRPARCHDPTDRDEALPERRRGRPLLPEAGAGEPARLAADGHGRVPERPHRDRAVPGRRRSPRLGREPRVPRPEPVAGARVGRRSSRRAACRPRSAAGRHVRRRADASRCTCARCSRSTGSIG